jgi:hypothetical protein
MPSQTPVASSAPAHAHACAEAHGLLPPLPGDYHPLDLSANYNGPTALLEDPHEVSLGMRCLHGLPFRFAEGAARHTLLVLGRQAQSPRVPLNARANWLIFAHALLEPDLYEGGVVGSPCADYLLQYADGTTHVHTIRQRFEIGPTPRKWTGRAIPLDWGQTPFLALNDAQHRLMDRCCGRFDAAGARLVDIEDPQSRVPYVLPYRFYLWPLRNPFPDKVITHLALRSLGPRVLIGAITRSELEEDPFGRGVSQDLLVSLAGRAMDETVAVSVDRGFHSYTYRLAGGNLDADPHFPKGWGAAPHTNAGAGYVRVTAQPSATLTVRAGEQLLAACRWRDLLAARELQLDGGVQLRLAAADRTWVRTRIVEAGSGVPLPCRLHMRTMDGVPLAPYGHHAHINSDGNTWNLDIGGDVRLGAQTHAYVDGECEGWLPVGKIIVEAARGFEYEPLHALIEIAAGQKELVLTLQRVGNAGELGYRSGDTHVHFVSTQGAELEARGEDLNVVNLLLTQWGHLYTNTEDFTGAAHVSADRKTVVYACQENRTNMLGHMSLLGLTRPIMPWCTGGSEEADLGGGLETTLSHWADECHAQGGTVILAHFPVPNGETAALIATRRLDAVEMIAYDDYNIREYYRYLNAGYRLPLVAGTDKMTSEVPVGLMRTYAQTGERFDYAAWCDGIKGGDTFISSGPILTLSVNGRPPGVLLDQRGGTRVTVRSSARSIFPIDRLEIVANGRVVGSQTSAEPVRSLELECSLSISADTWVVARCYAPGDHIARHHDVWHRPVMAHTSPVYVAAGASYDPFDREVADHMMNVIEGARLYIIERARTSWAGAASHRHGRSDHTAFLLAPLDEAKDELRRRIEQHAP